MGWKHRRKVFISLGLIVLVFSGKMLFGQAFQEKTRKILSLNPIEIDEYGHTNILLLGVAGKNEEGGNLSDSIMIASVDPNKPSVSLLSLPRDLYIDSKIGSRKINEIYAAARFKHGDAKGIEVIQDAVSKFTNTEVHYTAVINFQIFSDSIDLLGGIDLFIPEDIEDPFYPDENYGYQTFTIRKGLQTLDGATALKYARSRKTSSDYQRAKRQQEIFLAIRRKVESEGFAANASKIREFYDLFRRRVNTNIGLTELLALAKIGMGIDYGDVVSTVFNDDPNKKGGLLFTPAKEFYGGQFVLLPEDINDTKTFMYLVLQDPDIFLENAQISVLNGSDVEGRAGTLGARLRRLGFHVIDIGNYDTPTPLPKTFIRDLSGGKKEKTLEFLKKNLGIQQVEQIDPMLIDPNNLVDLEIIIGAN